VSAAVPTVLQETDRFVIVNKPAGLPVTGVVHGAALCVEGVLAAHGWPDLYAMYYRIYLRTFIHAGDREYNRHNLLIN